MMRLFTALVVVAVLSCAVLAAPIPMEEKYAVKLPVTPLEDQVTLEKSYTKHAFNFKSTDSQGTVIQERSQIEIRTLEYERAILKVEGSEVVQFTHRYTKAVVENDRGKREPSYLNRTITFERVKEGKFQVSWDAGPDIEVTDQFDLRRQVEMLWVDKFSRALEPARMVKPGESWIVDGKKVAAAMSNAPTKVYADTSKASVTLKTFKKGKQPWGTMEASLELPVKSMSAYSKLEDCSMTISGTVETPLDGSFAGGSSKLLGTFKLKAVQDGGQKGTHEVDGTFEEEKSSELKTK